jgi:hypothetical protein
MRAYLSTKGMRLMGSATAADLIWVGPGLDVVGGEVTGAEDPTSSYMRRALSYGKNWTNLRIGSTPPTAADVLKYLRQALLLGYYPGFNGSYWSSPTSYNRDRALFKQYVPLIRKVVTAGWKPIPYATPSDASIYVERFDDEVATTFYLTAQNSSTSTKTFQMTVDGASLGAATGAISLQELVGNVALSTTRSGSNILFTDTLAPGETALYRLTGGTGGTPAPTPTPTTGNVVSNGGFESGSGAPTGWTLGTSLTSGSWSWDATTAHSGARSARLAVPGVANLVSPGLQSAPFTLTNSKTYTLSAWLKSSSIAGTYEPMVWVIETDAAGNLLEDGSGDTIRHAVSADAGTTGWVQKTETFTTDPRCARAYIYVSIYKGRGTVWVDDVEVK